MAEKKETKAAAKKEKSIKPYQKKRHCPKCGPGVNLAAHKTRQSCGKCGYYEKK